jgi:PAS domain S-box-containing protein
MTEITGYTMEQINKLGWHQTVYPDPGLQARAVDRMERMREGHDLAAEEWEITRADGEKRIVEISTSILNTESGRTHVLALMQDVTQRKRAEEVRKQLEAQLRQAHKLKAVEQLASGVSHDFNSVLAVIQGNAELLRAEWRRRDLADPKHRIADTLEEILKAAGRGQRLVRDLLSFGQERSWCENPTNLNECVDHALQMSRGLLDGNVMTTLSKEEALRMVRADPGKVERALLNLIVNARDAMPDGGTLTIETANVDLDAADVAAYTEMAPGPHVLVRVSDTGMGIDKATQERLFEPFFTTKPVGQGSGLGLAIVHGIVTRAGGHIAVDSDLGKGTTFRLYFPAASHSTAEYP